MGNLKELQTKEALKRLKILQEQYELIDTVITEFENESVIYYSEYINKVQQGILYWISNKEEYVTAIKEFEDKYQALVYHVILTPMELLLAIFINPIILPLIISNCGEFAIIRLFI